MPVVDINVKRLVRLVGAKTNKKKIIDALPYLGLDIESQKDDTIKVEYSPNRPDYSTDYGIAQGLRGLLGIKTGAQKITPKPAKYSIRVSPKLARIRPVIMGVFAKNLTLDDDTLKQLIAMQEDLHAGICRNRRLASIGVHDADSITFPLEYTTRTKDTEFVPLGSEHKLDLNAILKATDVGRKHASLVTDYSNMPILCDADGKILSFPPVINSAHTALTCKTRQIFVEVTGNDSRTVEDVLAIVACTLVSAGATLYTVKSKSKTDLGPYTMKLRPSLVRETLGLGLNTNDILTCLRRSRLDAVKSGSAISCIIPRYRFDILGEMDLVEEVALGYGIANIEPQLLAQESSGQISAESLLLEKISHCMVGLGYTEALNSSLAVESTLAGLVRGDTLKMLSVIESQTQSNRVMRDSLLAGLLGVLSRNVHESYPQNIYEIGTVFGRARPVDERTLLAAVIANKNASYTQAKSTLVAMLERCFCITPTTVASSHPALQEGHTADIRIRDRRVGVIGVASDATLERLRIRQPVAVFEIDLSAVSKIH